MLKRTQILLEPWQVEHYKIVSEKYDVSFSEMIRMALCLDIIMATKIRFPKHKIEIDKNVLEKAIKNRNILENMGEEEFHKMLSRIYFEARKATELWAKE